MKKNFRKVLTRSLHGGNFSLLWGLSDFCALATAIMSRKAARFAKKRILDKLEVFKTF